MSMSPATATAGEISPSSVRSVFMRPIWIAKSVTMNASVQLRSIGARVRSATATSAAIDAASGWSRQPELARDRFVGFSRGEDRLRRDVPGDAEDSQCAGDRDDPVSGAILGRAGSTGRPPGCRAQPGRVRALPLIGAAKEVKRVAGRRRWRTSRRSRAQRRGRDKRAR